MATSIKQSYLEFAQDEGYQTAIDDAQDAQLQLEKLAELASVPERQHVLIVLQLVNDAIKAIHGTDRLLPTSPIDPSV